MKTKITYFVHGTTTDNEADLMTGWAHGELSELGKEQTRELGGLVKDKKFDVVFCSDLQRAIDSAERGFGNKYKIIQDDRLRECDYGVYTQKPVAEYKNDMLQYVDTPFRDGESYSDVQRRMVDFIEYIKGDYSGKHIAIVAHQAPQLALDVLLKDKTWAEAIAEDWRNTKSWQPGWEYEC